MKTESRGEACFAANSCSPEELSRHFLSLLPSCQELCGPQAECVMEERFYRAADCTSAFPEDRVSRSKPLSKLQEA